MFDAISESPLISVTLPNFNHGKYLAGCIEGILDQTYSNLELLITDDGSTDDSREVITQFSKRDCRVKPIFFERNLGVQEAHRNCFGRLSGELVYSYSADDKVCQPSFFASCVEALRQNPFIGGVASKALLVDSNTELVVGGMGFAKPGVINGRDFVSGFLSETPYFVPGISSIWRLDCINAVGGFDPRLGPQSDYFVNHAIPTKFGLFFIDDWFVMARQFEDRSSYSGNTSLEDEIYRFRLFAHKMSLISRDCSSIGQWNSWLLNKCFSLFMKRYRIDPL